jgi:integrase
MTVRRLLTDRYLRALRPAPPGKRVEVYDARLPGFGVRVSDNEDGDPSRRGKAGRVAFILYCRFTPGAAATRRVIGAYGPDAMSLEEARRIAGEWRSLVARGVDPAVIEAERRAVEARERAQRIRHSFTVVAEAFIADKLAKERKGKVAERNLRNTFMAAWGERPIAEITTSDVRQIIDAKKRTAPKMAGALLVLIKRFFNWVIDQHDVYGLIASPCDRLKVKAFAGEMRSRDRRLNDNEVFALWRASARMGHPVGSVYRVLALTGLRLREAAELSWQELHGDTIVIPAARMKGREGRAVEHSVPITQALRDVIATVPRIKGEPYLFSLRRGQPLTMTGAMKADLDRRMLRTLRALARRRGDDHRAVELERWTNHDLRRVVRSGLAALGIADNVAESILAHKAVGIVATYNVHKYEDEKREALELWARHIASLSNPEPAKVVKLSGRRR